MNRLILLKNHVSNSLQVTEKEIINDGSVGILYLKSAKNLNALNFQMRSEICSVLKEYQDNPQIKVVVILSKIQKAFCAGADINEFKELTTEKIFNKFLFEELSNSLYNFTKPLICGVNGFALGGGCELSLACDFIFASKEAQFGLPELQLGLIPGIGGTVRLTNLIGKNKASYHMFTSERIKAEEAKSLGMVIEICENLENLHKKCIEVAKNIAMKSQITLIMCKQAIRGALDTGDSEALKNEHRLFKAMFNTKAKNEGVNAFIEKRKPNFRDN